MKNLKSIKNKVLTGNDHKEFCTSCCEFYDCRCDHNCLKLKENSKIVRQSAIVMDEARGCKEIKLTEKRLSELNGELRCEINNLQYDKPIVILGNKIYDFDLTKVEKTFENFELGDQRSIELKKWSRKKSYYRLVHCDACDIDMINGSLKSHDKTTKHTNNLNGIKKLTRLY